MPKIRIKIEDDGSEITVKKQYRNKKELGEIAEAVSKLDTELNDPTKGFRAEK